MTRDEILALSGRELDTKVAEVLFGATYFPCITNGAGVVWKFADGSIVESWEYKPSDDRNAAALVLAEIAKRDLEFVFGSILFNRSCKNKEPSLAVFFHIANAEPSEICRAALLSVMETTNAT